MRYQINTIEPIWWALFSAGGFLIALLLPIFILIFGVMMPLGAVPEAAYSGPRMTNLLGNWLIRLFLFVLVALPLFHWAHRFRYFLFDLGIRFARLPIAVLCYGAAIVGTTFAAITLIRL